MTGSVRVDEQPLWQLAMAEGLFIVVAAAIIYSRGFTAAVILRVPLITEVVIGLPIGAVLGALVGFGLLASPLRRNVVTAVLPLRPVTSAVWSIVAVGLLAGIGEELLFRAALQGWIGLAWASILFGLAHSGTARLHKGVTFGKIGYLLATVTAGMLLGRLYQSVGLVASICAHAAFDVAILLVLSPAIAAAHESLTTEAASNIVRSDSGIAGFRGGESK